MGFVATLWYLLHMKIIQEQVGIDRTKHYSDEMKIEPNIELIVPSKEETVSFN